MIYDLGSGWTAERVRRDFSHYDILRISQDGQKRWETDINEKMDEETMLDQARLIVGIFEAGYSKGFRDGEQDMWTRLFKAMESGRLG